MLDKPRNLNHMALIETVSAQAGVSPKIVEKVLRAFFDVVGWTVASGFKVSVTNFGTWYRSEVSSRVRRDPNTGEEWTAPRTNYPRFRYSPRLRNAIVNKEVPSTLKKRGH